MPSHRTPAASECAGMNLFIGVVTQSRKFSVSKYDVILCAFPIPEQSMPQLPQAKIL